MARKKRSRSRSRRRKSKVVAKTPRTIGGIWRAQPLLVKGGMILTGLELAVGTNNQYSQSPVDTALASGATLQQKVRGTANTLKGNAMNLNTYKPLAYGVIGHYVAKKAHLKGV